PRRPVPARPATPGGGGRAALVEVHGREAAGGTAGEQRAVVGVDAAIEQKADVAPRRREVELKVGIAEHGRHGDVAAGQPPLGPLEIHGRRLPAASSPPIIGPAPADFLTHGATILMLSAVVPAGGGSRRRRGPPGEG